MAVDPLEFPFRFGGQDYGGIEPFNIAQTITFPSPDPASPQYLSVVLDTNTSEQVDGFYPSWCTFLFTVVAMPVVPVVRVATTPGRSQSAEGATTAAANGQFTVSRHGGSLAQDLDVEFDMGGAADRTADYTVSFSSTGSSYDPATGHGTVRIPANATSATITIEGADDGSGGTDAAIEDAVITIAPKPQYKPDAAASTSTVSIIDRKKYFIYFYGTGGPDLYGDLWLDMLADVQTNTRGYATLGETINGLQYGGTRENRVAGALNRFFGAINRDGGKVISAAEAESSDVTMAGHSLGGTAAVNFSYYVNRVGKTIEDYRLDGAVLIKSLVTWDPNVDLLVGPLVVKAQHPTRSIETNVKKSRNYYQRRAGWTNWERLDAQGNVIGNARLPRQLGEMTIVGNTIQTAAGDDRGAPTRLDTTLANQPEVLDRPEGFIAVPWDPTDNDPLYNGGRPAERRYRLYGNKDARRGVNHSTMTWYAWRMTKNDLA